MAIPYPNPLWSRLLSITLAAAVSTFILLNSNAIAALASDIRQAMLSLSLWGAAAGFIHGMGFVPRLSFWQLAFHPLLGWLLMGAGGVFLLHFSLSSV